MTWSNLHEQIAEAFGVPVGKSYVYWKTEMFLDMPRPTHTLKKARVYVGTELELFLHDE